jgi:hypothetical protein
MFLFVINHIPKISNAFEAEFRFLTEKGQGRGVLRYPKVHLDIMFPHAVAGGQIACSSSGSLDSHDIYGLGRLVRKSDTF